MSKVRSGKSGRGRKRKQLPKHCGIFPKRKTATVCFRKTPATHVPMKSPKVTRQDIGKPSSFPGLINNKFKSCKSDQLNFETDHEQVQQLVPGLQKDVNGSPKNTMTVPESFRPTHRMILRSHAKVPQMNTNQSARRSQGQAVSSSITKSKRPMAHGCKSFNCSITTSQSMVADGTKSIHSMICGYNKMTDLLSYGRDPKSIHRMVLRSHIRHLGRKTKGSWEDQIRDLSRFTIVKSKGKAPVDQFIVKRALPASGYSGLLFNKHEAKRVKKSSSKQASVEESCSSTKITVKDKFKRKLTILKSDMSVLDQVGPSGLTKLKPMDSQNEPGHSKRFIHYAFQCDHKDLNVCPSSRSNLAVQCCPPKRKEKAKRKQKKKSSCGTPLFSCGSFQMLYKEDKSDAHHSSFHTPLPINFQVNKEHPRFGRKVLNWSKKRSYTPMFRSSKYLKPVSIARPRHKKSLSSLSVSSLKPDGRGESSCGF